jgi:hypothetical protein
VVEQKVPVRKNSEHEGLYDKITAYGTIAGVLVAVVALFASMAEAAIAYFTYAYSAHWPPFSSPPSASPTNASTVIHSRATAPTSPSVDGVPADYQGTWEGNISGSAGPFEATMNLRQGTDGSKVGVFQNETYGCRGAIYLESGDGESGDGPISLRIVTTSNPYHDCVLLAYAQATLTSDGLYFAFDQTATVPSGDGTLTSVSAVTHPPQ